MQTTRRELLVVVTVASVALLLPPQPALLFYLDGMLIGSADSLDHEWTWPSDATGVLTMKYGDGRKRYWSDTTGLGRGDVPTDFYLGAILVDGDVVAHAGDRLKDADVPSDQRTPISKVRLWEKGRIVAAGEL